MRRLCDEDGCTETGAGPNPNTVRIYNQWENGWGWRYRNGTGSTEILDLCPRHNPF